MTANGYSVIEPNFRCRLGEMDLVAKLGDQWVFVEVKTRRGTGFGPARDAITSAKAGRLLQIAETYLQERGHLDVNWRIDLIAVQLDAQGKLLRIDHIENAVSGW